MKSRGERDFADAETGVSQEVTRGFEPGARYILDKINASYPPEISAQIVRVTVDRVRYSRE